jgi:hypothetical protein
MKRLSVIALAFLLCVMVSSAPARTWTSADGRHTTEAELVAVEQGKASLKKPDGALVLVPLASLSEGDRRFALSWQADQAKASGGTAASAPAKDEPLLYPVFTPKRYGYIDATGKMIIPPQFTDALSFSEGLAYAAQNKWGFIDSSGKMVIPPQYATYGDMTGFHDGLARVLLDKKFGFVDKTGKLVIPCKYVAAHDFSEGLAYVVEKDLGGYIDTAGKTVIEPVQIQAAGGADFHEGVVCITDTNKRHYLIDKTGKTVLDHLDDIVGCFSEGLATKLGGFIGKDGKWVIKPSPAWSAYNPFHDGCAMVYLRTGNVAYLDKTGKVVASDFSEGRNFSEGLAAVRTGKAWQYIDNTGKAVIPGADDWQTVESFKNGLARIQTTKGKCRYIDKTG